MAEKQSAKEPVRCKCGGEPCVIVREYTAQVYCTKCGREVTRTTRESALKAWNERTQKGRRRK